MRVHQVPKYYNSAQPPPSTSAATTFASSETFSIFQIPIMRRPFIEGRARIIESVRGLPDLYRVQFEGEDVTRLRLVHGGIWQSDSEAVSEALLNHFRVSLMPELLVELPVNFDTRGTSSRP